MAKERSFWEWIFGKSCCGSRGKKDRDYYTWEKEGREGKDKDDNTKSRTSEKRFEEDYYEPGSGFTEVSLSEDSAYRISLHGEGEDGSVEIR
jgi:hypothetical protein